MSKQAFLILLFFCLSIILPIIWFPKGYIIGGGDVGIPLWRSGNLLKIQSYSWMDTNSTGNSYPNVFTAEPFYLFFSTIEKFGISADISQKFLFFIILFGSSISIFFLAKHFFTSKGIAFVAAFFYLFNLTSLSIWQRGVHNGMLMLLLAPLSLLILVKGVDSQKYISILWINIVSFLLSYVFGSVGYVFSLWLLWTIYLLIVLGKDWKDKSKRNFIFSFYFILVVSWIGTNAWWIVHLLFASNYALGQFTQAELKSRGSDVLIGLKPYHEASYIFRGLSRFIHYIIKDWGEIYSNTLFIVLSWIPPLIIFSTTLIKRNYKSTSWKFLITLTIIILVISKGVNPPLGLLNKIPYDLFQFLAPLRNPYEKVGILLIIPMSLLFALGLSQIISFLNLKKVTLFSSFIILAAVLSLTVLVWPLWLGRLFVSDGRKYIVSIPSYYQEANNWLKNRVTADDSRVLHLPLSWGESVDYNWGYTGFEPSLIFFDNPSIGYQIGVSSVDSRIRDILISIHNQDTEKVQKAVASLNIGWVVIHNETVWRPRILESPERINSWILASPDFLEHQADFGPLSIFRVKDKYRLGHIYKTNKLISINKVKPNQSLNIWNKIIERDDSFITQIQERDKALLNKFISEDIITPTKSSIYSPLPIFDEKSALDSLANVRFLPDSFIYSLVLIKEKVAAFIKQDDPVTYCFVLGGKRLKEASLLARKNKFSQANESLIRYENQLDECIKIDNSTVIAYMGGNLADLTLGQLLKQKAVLEAEFNSTETEKARKRIKVKLDEYLSDLGLSPRYNIQKVDDSKSYFFINYSVLEDGNYKIKLYRPDESLVKTTPPKIVSIDEQPVNLVPETVNPEYIEYPVNSFGKGFHEIHIETEPSQNLLATQLEVKASSPDAGFASEIDLLAKRYIFTGKALSELRYLTFNLNNLDVEKNYELVFDLLLNQGAPPYLTIAHDSDPMDSTGNTIPAVKGQILYATDLPDGWKRVKINYTPVLNSTFAKLSFILAPQTEVKFRNITLSQAPDYDLFLEKKNNVPIQKMEKGEIWNKIDPTLYEVRVDNQKTPFILVFSETFHPLWQVFDSKDNPIKLPHISINGFANGWIVENPLPEKIKIKFTLQKSRNQGIFFSIVSLILMISAVSYLDYKRKTNV